MDKVKIKKTIAKGSGFVEGKERIKAAFLKLGNKKEFYDFLKDEYGTGGSSETENYYGNNHDNKGIEMYSGSWDYFKGYENSKFFSWAEIGKLIAEMITTGEYDYPNVPIEKELTLFDLIEVEK